MLEEARDYLADTEPFLPNSEDGSWVLEPRAELSF